MNSSIKWGPTGEQVYRRTYSRVKPDGTHETWMETVERVARGNLELVYGEQANWDDEVWTEYADLRAAMLSFEFLPAGRHLWASGVKGRQYLFNCHVAGWDSLASHVEFVLMRLAEGGGVGANYSTRLLKPLRAPVSPVKVHVVCDPSHPDYEALKAAGVLSDEYDANWPGAFNVEDTREGWAAAIIDLIEAAYRPGLRHANRVFDVSRVRWKGARLKTMGGSASGPEPLSLALNKIGQVLSGRHDWQSGRTFRRHLTPLEAMAIDHAIAEAIVAGGARRSARMSIVEWDDPYVFEFIRCKRDPEQHWSTNISVAYDDDFLLALENSDHPMHDHAREVYYAVVEGMLTNGEPGLWNRSLAQKGEPNEVIATNPCGEICLEAWENCNLGHVNLDAFVDSQGQVRWEALKHAHRLATRFLIRATYGDVIDDKQAAVLARNRRIGVGHFGVQGWLVKQGIRFSRAPLTNSVAWGLVSLASEVYSEAVAYAHKLRIPVPVKTRTVAPTGTIAKMPGRTEGIHPIYSRYFIRRVRYSNSDPAQISQVRELRASGHYVEPDLYAANTDVVSFVTKDQLVAEVEEMGLASDIVESADELTLKQMLEFQEMYQTYWADNAVSFTVNVPAESHQAAALARGEEIVPAPSAERVEEVAAVLREYLPRLKGTTLMVDGSRPQAPYERLSEEEFRFLEFGGPVATDAGYDEECANGACPIK